MIPAMTVALARLRRKPRASGDDPGEDGVGAVHVQ